MTAQVQQSDYNTAFVPPLESGDRLTRYEFERQYGASSGNATTGFEFSGA
ncbi:MAG: hypothetical protein KME64_02590 [Scytonematopsis contorta HA4267-MV1]|jgi:hypothetical protein|nr:hypothetical protein [Scytonematopsis contorta HA4267-MV1]